MDALFVNCDVFIHIADYLSPLSIATCALTSTTMMNIFSQRYIWKQYIDHNKSSIFVKLCDSNDNGLQIYSKYACVVNDMIYLKQIASLSKVKSVEDMLQLKTIYCTYWNHFTAINTTCLNGLKWLEKLQKITLTSCKLMYIPESIQQLKQLKKLNLSMNDFSNDVIDLDNYRELIELTLCGSNVLCIKFPEYVIKLERLLLGCNQIKCIDHNINNLINLRVLRINNNKLEQIELEICELMNLTHLDVSNNSITNIPDDICKLINLTYIDLSCNMLLDINSNLYRCTSLRTLNASGNLISHISGDIANLINLQKLYLYENEISDIPSEINMLIYLQQLNLRSNNITYIPLDICYLQNLHTLYLSWNKIEHIPNEIINLTSLRNFYITHNKIISRPSFIKSMVNLEIFMM